MKSPITNTGKFIKSTEFDSENGKVLKITAEPELIVSANPKFGFVDGPNKGKTVRYKFTEDGNEKWFETKSLRFARALEAFEVGDTVRITRVPAGTDTQYSVTKVDDLSSIPF